MNELDHAIVLGDNKVYIDLTCLDENNAARDLTGATVVATMLIAGGTSFNPSAAIYGTASNGIIRVTLLATEIPTTGAYGAFELIATATWSDGTVKSTTRYRGVLEKKLA